MTQSASQIDVYTHMFKKMKTMSNEIERLRRCGGTLQGNDTKSADESADEILASELFMQMR